MSKASPVFERLKTRSRELQCGAGFWSLRYVDSLHTEIAVRSGVAEPTRVASDAGAMLTVIDDGGLGYAATADLTRTGLQAALDRAHAWARVCAQRPVTRFETPASAAARGVFTTPNLDRAPPDASGLLDLLMAEDAAAGRDPRIVDRSASITVSEVGQLWLTNHGGEVEQHHRYIRPGLTATAHAAGRTQTRSLAGQYNGFCRQGSAEVVDASGLVGSGARVADEALQLLAAPDCPRGVMDLLVMPDQMMLQIHESIGHPLELDRILGDERNFAGTSFVTPDMFGRYRYGSELLDVTSDPTRPEQFASYAFDDEGERAAKVYLIERGILVRPLGSALSARRAADLGYRFDPVANARACNWNRPPIDRMANLNIEPGTSSLAAMIASVEQGLLVRTNVSWSIDDSRNKFQFGCEWGQLIENGKLTRVVRNPNYRGVSANFWRSLKAVGDASTFEVMGTPYCGKGEPGQIIRVGHASPACLFGAVDVFGGAQ